MGDEKHVIDLESFANELPEENDLSKQLEDAIREAEQSKPIKVKIQSGDKAEGKSTEQAPVSGGEKGKKTLSDHLADAIADLDGMEKQPESLPEPKVEEEAKPKEDYYDRLLRVTADFENYRKRMIREKADNLRYANERFAVDLLPCLDNFERAMQSTDQTDVKSLLDGVRMIFNQLNGVMKRNGVEGFDPTGEPFDPARHQAMDVRATDAMEPNRVLEIYQKGYMLNDRLIRPAMVIVSAAPVAEASQAGTDLDENVELDFGEPGDARDDETKQGSGD